MYYEEFVKGQTFELPTIQLSQSEIETYAAQHDPQRIHMDEAFAKRGTFRGIIASGLHTLSAVWGAWIRVGAFGDETIGGTGLDFVEWPAPVRPEDTLRPTAEVVDTIPSVHGRHGTIVLKLTVTNQHGKTVLITQSRGILKAKFPNSKEGFVEVEGGKVWYQQVGQPKSGPVASANRGAQPHNPVGAPATARLTRATPLILLHGGPGSSHFGMQALAAALQDERPVIHYDQLGCGKSDRPTDVALWTTERFVRELADLRAQLGLAEVHLLGQSWGTMLLADYLLTKPVGVKSATFSSPCLSAPRWVADANAYRKDLPPDVQKTLLECEATGSTDSKAYDEAAEVYMLRHVCRVDVPPLLKSRGKATFGKQVYHTMWGPSEFYPNGNLKTYDRTDRLGEITVPALFTCGRYDEAAPGSTEYYHSLVPKSEFHIFEHSSHSALREEPEAYIGVIRDFLNRVDAGRPTGGEFQ